MPKPTHVDDLDNVRLQTELARQSDQPWYVDTPCSIASEEKPYLNEEDPEEVPFIEAWTDQEHPRYNEAKKICEDCPVRALCVQDAVIRQDAYGLRGGIFFYLGGFLSTEENAKMKNKYLIKGKVRNSAKDADKIDW